MIRYLEISQLACDMTFGIFMVTWLITRHFLFNIIIYSTFFVGPKYLILEWDWDWNRGIYVNSWTYLMFCFLLVALQVCQDSESDRCDLLTHVGISILAITANTMCLVRDDLQSGLANAYDRRWSKRQPKWRGRRVSLDSYLYYS